ncbi:MAG: stage II sporulation protein M [Synergistaceae bacterium]|nr:stage II sporulation protein M [Synergistaceae bacterium]
MGELRLRSAEFRKSREGGWQKLEDMISRVEKEGISALSASEATEIATLYRSAVSSLSVARNIALDRNLLLYLENLTLRAYLVVYGPRTGMLRHMADFFMFGWPEAVRALRRHLLVITIFFAVGAAAGYAMTMADINNYHLFVPELMAQGRLPSSTSEELREHLFPEWPGFVRTFVVFANSLFRHNSVVGILAFGLGFLLGVPTILLAMYNGAIMGAFIALHASKGLGIECVAWLSIHGVTEILAVLLMMAGGLAIAERIIFPNENSRLESLRLGGRDAARVAMGSVFMLFIAGIIEGGFRQLIANTPLRFAFAAVTGALWACYFIFAGRDDKHGLAD